MTTATTYEERETADFISESTESNGTNEPVTPTTSTKYAEDLISTRQDTLMTTETLETECTTEIELNRPEDKTPVMTTATTYEEKQSEPADFISENTESKGTIEPATPTTSTKYTEDFISTRQETLMTTETLETECTTEIELQTPEDKTPAMTKSTTYEERQSEPADFISENTESKGTIEPATPTMSTKYADFTMNREETLTTENLETECTTEIELNTPEDKRPMMTTSTTYEERETEPADLISENTESKGINEPVTPTTSTKYAEDFISNRQDTLMTTEALETECTTEIELQTPEDKTPVMTTATTYEERETADFISESTESNGTNEPVTPTTSIKYTEDFISENTESKDTIEPATPTMSTKYSEDFTMNREETLTTETLETECTTEIELNTPEDKRPMMTTSTTYEERQSEPADFISENTESKGTIELANTNHVHKIRRRFHFNQTRDINDNRGS